MSPICFHDEAWTAEAALCPIMVHQALLKFKLSELQRGGVWRLTWMGWRPSVVLPRCSTVEISQPSHDITDTRH